MRVWSRSAYAATVVCSTVHLAGKAHAEPLWTSHFTCVAYGLLFVIQEKDFFAKEEVEVELINIGAPCHRRTRIKRAFARPGGMSSESAKR